MIVRELLTKLGFVFEKKGANDFKKAFDGIEDRLRSIRNQAAAFSLGVSTPILFAAKSAVQAGSEFEQLNVAYETLLGSAEKGQKFTKDLAQFAATTPFNIQNLGLASKQLLATGISAQEVIPLLKDLGDISALVGTDRLPYLILALGQVKNAGFLTGGELRQFTENSVGLVEELSKITGHSAAEISSNVKDLKIPFETVRQVLRNLTSEGGRFFKGMEKQSKTLGGQFSNLEDSVYLLKVELSDLFRTEQQDLLIVVREFLDYLKNLSPETKKIVGYLALFTAALGPIIAFLSQVGLAIIAIGPAFSAIASVIGAVLAPEILAIIAIVAAIIGSIYLLYQNFKKVFENPTIKKGLENIKNGLNDLIYVLSYYLAPAFEYVKEKIQSALNSEFVKKYWKQMLVVISPVLAMIYGLIKAFKIWWTVIGLVYDKISQLFSEELKQKVFDFAYRLTPIGQIDAGFQAISGEANRLRGFSEAQAVVSNSQASNSNNFNFRQNLTITTNKDDANEFARRIAEATGLELRKAAKNLDNGEL